MENSLDYVVIFKSGIAITVEGKAKLLQIMLVVPETFKGKVLN